MQADLQRRIQRYGWDKAADYYESFWQNQLRPAQEKLLEMAAIRSGERVIDVACGTGLVSFRAAGIVDNNGFVLATDISDAMVNIGTRMAQEQKLSNIEFKRMDAEALKVPDEEFDVAVCALGLMYTPNPVMALKEMKRVIKKNGRAVAAVWGQRAHCGWAEIFEIIDRRVASEVCPMFFNLGNGDILKRSFEMAGLSNVGYHRLNTILHYDTAESACGAAFAGGPVALAYHKFTDEVKNEVHREYLESIEPFRHNEAYEVPGEFVVAMGESNE